VDTVDTSFGSDRFGLVWGYRFVPGEPATPIDCEMAESVLAAPSGLASPAEFLWC
jgi:zinc transporter